MRDDLNALAVFAVIAEEASLRAAADRLGVTRSAVSQMLRRLEAELGVALVRRTTRAMRLTEEGARLREEIAPDMPLMVKLARSGAGISFGMEEIFLADLGSGTLVPLLDDFCPPFQGFFLYYPSRRNMPARLRAFIEIARRHRDGPRAGGSPLQVS